MRFITFALALVLRIVCTIVLQNILGLSLLSVSITGGYVPFRGHTHVNHTVYPFCS